MKPNLFPKNLTNTQQGYIFQVIFHACAINKIETPKGSDEDISIKDRIFFIENIPMQQMEAIKKTVESMEFGWKLEHKIQCPHCKHEESETIPIQQNFFG